MRMILDSTDDLCGLAAFVVMDSSHIRVKFFCDIVGNERVAVFGREGEVDVNVR
jgi:hypothetical protein